MTGARGKFITFWVAVVALSMALLLDAGAAGASSVTSCRPASGRGCPTTSHASGGSSVSGGRIVLTLSAYRRIEAEIAQQSPGAAGPHDVYKFVLMCVVLPDPACAGSFTMCAGPPYNLPGKFLFLVYRGPDDDHLGLTGAMVCIGLDDEVDLQQLHDDVREAVRRYLDVHRPSLQVRPDAIALVHLPAIMWDAGGSPPPMKPLVLDDAQVAVTLTGSWSWSFGDGADVATDNPGQGYDGVDPAQDPAHYPVLHTFDTAGDRTVGLTVAWKPTYTILHAPGTWDLDPVTYRATRVLAVHEARAVLVGAAT